MSAWEKLAENRIQEALASGELAAPPHGSPLDLTEYFALPAAERAGIVLLRNAGVLPPEAELLRRIARLEDDLATAGPGRAHELRAELQSVQVAFRLALERRARARASRDA